jgi:hypothetical protein
MIEMISGKLKSITRQSLAVLERAAEQWENTKRKCEQLFG